MSQFIYTMQGVSKTVPPKRQIIKDISLSFFPGAKIGLLGLNGAGKSTVLRIMAGVDTDFVGEARPLDDQGDELVVDGVKPSPQRAECVCLRGRAYARAHARAPTSSSTRKLPLTTP